MPSTRAEKAISGRSASPSETAAHERRWSASDTLFRRWSTKRKDPATRDDEDDPPVSQRPSVLVRRHSSSAAKGSSAAKATAPSDSSRQQAKRGDNSMANIEHPEVTDLRLSSVGIDQHAGDFRRTTILQPIPQRHYFDSKIPSRLNIASHDNTATVNNGNIQAGSSKKTDVEEGEQQTVRVNRPTASPLDSSRGSGGPVVAQLLARVSDLETRF
ncbi:hypothetical protein H4217_007513, partial [Coemansia sp. RSA 1939]